MTIIKRIFKYADITKECNEYIGKFAPMIGCPYPVRVLKAVAFNVGAWVTLQTLDRGGFHYQLIFCGRSFWVMREPNISRLYFGNAKARNVQGAKW